MATKENVLDRPALAKKPRCEACDDTGWVCENHPNRPASCAGSKRWDVCECGPGAPCLCCNTDGKIDERPDMSRMRLTVTADRSGRH
jgi:hypothetical protein